MSENNKINILGVGISAIDMNDALKQIEPRIISKEKSYVCVCPNHTIMESQQNEDLKKIVNSACIATPDGMSVVWVSKLLGYKNVRQVCGTELMIRLSALSAEKGYKNFYYGGSEGVANKLAERLCKMFPGLKITGTLSPPFRALTPEEKKNMIKTINDAQPDILWIGLGMPKQELWIGEFFEYLNATVIIGVGAAFDFLSGSKKRAPRWLQVLGLEWLYRLIQEPKRLWKRNLYHPIFLAKVIVQKIKMKKNTK